MLDIDDFKKYNDKFGHSKGDEILEEISKILQMVVNRPLDIVSRYGGEEFVIALYDCTEDATVLKTKEIHSSISKLHHFIDVEETNPLTVSIGYIFTISVKGLDFEEVIKMADKEMYNAKNSGKNRTCGRSLS